MGGHSNLKAGANNVHRMSMTVVRMCLTDRHPQGWSCGCAEMIAIFNRGHTDTVDFFSPMTNHSRNTKAGPFLGDMGLL